jgi:hypothetical protein
MRSELPAPLAPSVVGRDTEPELALADIAEEKQTVEAASGGNELLDNETSSNTNSNPGLEHLVEFLKRRRRRAASSNPQLAQALDRYTALDQIEEREHQIGTGINKAA